MTQMLKKLISVRGVTGAYIYNPDRGILEKYVTKALKVDKPAKIADALIKIFIVGNKGASNLSEISICYEESVVIIREPADHHYLIVFYDKPSSCNQSKKVINRISDDLKLAINKRQQIKKIKTLPKGKSLKVHSGSNGFQAEVLLKSSPMSKSLQAMQMSLTKVMGPVANIIFIDALNNWIETSQPSFASIPSLIDILGNEINDASKFADYQGSIIPFIEK